MEAVIIGITGGVGSGKSVVMDILKEDYGAAIILADNVGHEVMAKDGAAYPAIKEHFGTGILDGMTGEIDRKKLGAYVFNNKKELQKLNSIIHPAVKKEIMERIQNIRQKEPDKLIAIEAALLLEDNYDEICDVIWYVYADETVRRRRLREGRGYSDEKTDSVMQNQMSEAEFKCNCDDIIDNSGDIEATRKNLQKTVAKYMPL